MIHNATPRADHPAPQMMTSADHHEMAASHYDAAAKNYRLAAGYYNYGDYQGCREHARLAKDYSQKADADCALANHAAPAPIRPLR